MVNRPTAESQKISVSEKVSENRRWYIDPETGKIQPEKEEPTVQSVQAAKAITD
jgi:hypothetical protein